MKFFYLDISRKTSEMSAVHMSDCPNLPPMLDRSYLGPFNNALEALRNAKARKKNVTVCEECCRKEIKTVTYFVPVPAAVSVE